MYTVTSYANGEHHIVERHKHVIKKVKSKRRARGLMRSLNLGGGFDGHTPAFFTVETLNFAAEASCAKS